MVNLVDTAAADRGPRLSKLRLCMIGCGAFARQFHGPAQRRCASENDRVGLSACCDHDLTRATTYAHAFGFARTYTDIAAMLEAEQPHAVVIAVPPPLTTAIATQVFRWRCAVMLEKPPALTLSDLRALSETAAANRVITQVAFNRRYMPVMQDALRWLKEQADRARPMTIDYEMSRFACWDADFSTTAVHAVDAICVLGGSPLAQGTVEFASRGAQGRQAWDATLDLLCESGTVIHLTIRPVTGVNRERATLHGQGWSLDLTVPFPAPPFEQGRLQCWQDNACVHAYTDGGDVVERMGVYHETRAFLEAAMAGRTPGPSLAECVQQVQIMEQLRHGQDGRLDL